MNRRAAILLAALALLIPYPAASDVPIAASAISGFEAIRTAGITVVGTSYPTPAVPQLRTIAGTGLKGDEGTGKPSGNPSQGRPDGTHRTPGSASTFRTLSPAPSPAPATLAPSARAVPRLASRRSAGTPQRGQDSRPTGSTTGVQRGTASTYGPGYDGWLALPSGPGHRVRVCGAGGCIVRVSNDAGPSLAMQRLGRIVDLDVADFETVCGVPWTRGLCRVTVTP